MQTGFSAAAPSARCRQAAGVGRAAAWRRQAVRTACVDAGQGGGEVTAGR